MKRTIDKRKTRKSRMAVANAASQKKYKQYIYDNKKNIEKNSNNLVIKVFITIAIVIVAIVLVVISGVFNISEIIIEGNMNVSKEQIISFSRIEQGKNIFAISKNDIKNHLKECSYINDVKIKRILPNKIKLIVEEREKEYALQLANSYVYIDKRGYVLEISNETPNVPIILGFITDLSNIKENSRLDNQDLEKIGIVQKIMETADNHSLKDLITKVDISNSENYAIYLDNEAKIAYIGNGTELNTRFIYIKAILKEQQGKAGEIFANVDLNEEWVYFAENTQ